MYHYQMYHYRTIPKIAIIILSMTALVVVAMVPGVAQDSRAQERAAPIKPPEKTVEQVFKNIKVLNGMPQSQLYPAMRFMAASLGFQCGDCHVIKGFIDAAADDKPEKQTAREMIKMVREINKSFGEGEVQVSCYTCHRGSRSPQNILRLPLATSTSRPNAVAELGPISSSLPSADDVLSKYFAALGGKAAADRINSGVVKGTTTTATGQTIAYEAEQLMPDKGREAFALPDADGRPCAGDSRCEYQRVINAQQGWRKSGAGVAELVGEELEDQKLNFPLFQILKLKEQYPTFRVSGSDRIDDRDVYVINAHRLDGKSERLYFDIENGLLRRRISYMRTPIGTIPQQTDFADYGEVDGLRLPLTITISYADPGSRPIVRKFTEIKLNVSLKDSIFQTPQ